MKKEKRKQTRVHGQPVEQEQKVLDAVSVAKQQQKLKGENRPST